MRTRIGFHCNPVRKTGVYTSPLPANWPVKEPAMLEANPLTQEVKR